MSDKYELKDGVIYREGVKVATRDEQTGTIEYLPGMDRYRAPVTALLKATGLDRPPVTPPEVAARQAQVRKAGEAGSPATTTVDPAQTVVIKSLPPKLPSAEDLRIADLEAENARLRDQVAAAIPAGPPPLPPVVTSAPIPSALASVEEVNRARAQQAQYEQFYAEGCPRMNPTMGTKTPAFVNWVAKHHPEHARAIWATSRLAGGKHIEEIIAETRR